MIEFTTSVDAIHRGSGIYKDGVYVGGRYEQRKTASHEMLEECFPGVNFGNYFIPIKIRCTGDQFAR